MVIAEMNEQECGDLLRRVNVGRLGCARDNQPYVLPVFFAYEPGNLYVFSTLGQKIEWMRSNPKVCLQADETTPVSQWASVIANGRYQELPEPQFSGERARARKLLEGRHHWWQNALGERQLKQGDELIPPLFFRIQIESMSGLKASK